MKLKYIIISFIIVFSLSNTLNSQNTNTLYFMDEIAERNNLNPAFIPNCNFYLDFIFLPNLYLNIGTNNFVLNDLIYKQNGVPTTILSSQKNLDKFYQSLLPTTDLHFNFGLNILSFGFKIQKHYFTFDMGFNAEVYSYIPKDIFKLAFYGTPNSTGINYFDLSSLGIESTLYSKIGLGYMYKINNQWQIGTKIKFLMGYANVDTRIYNLQLEASRNAWNLKTDGNIQASLPISFNTNEDGSINFASAHLNNKTDLISLLYNPAGYGGAIDLGATYKPIKKLTISVSITDLGFIYWRKNTIRGSMIGEHQINSLFDYTIGDSITIEEQITNTFTQLGNDLLRTIHTNQNNETYTTMLRANFYAGVEYGILKNKISFGAVNRLSFNNRRVQDEITLAVNFRPLNWFNATIDYSFINGRWGNLGLGLNLRAGIFNMYLLADYIPLSYTRLNLGNMDNEKDLKVSIPNKTQSFNLQIGWTWTIGNYSADLDRDGVKGKKDHCPSTNMDFLRGKCPELKKKKQFVDKDGCDLDDDKDGIHNCYDQCPDTPLDIEVDSVGCPFDTDKDGIYDYQDNCPNTPEGVEVDSVGCPFDTDKDGIADYLDQCPETPMGVLVDTIGCPFDSDKDGIVDYLDLCPETPEYAKIDANGCPVDTDNDGVADYLDKCPETPNGIIVDEMGCPLDTDKDGILDFEDKCPTKPGPVDNFGCPELKKEVRNLFKKAMTGIQFESGKDIIKRSSYPILDQIVAVMELNPEYHLTINGHTDNAGDDDQNMQLSIDRAAAVGKYITNKGISTQRITTQGFGETKPIANNNTSKGRAENRRVEFEISYEEISFEKVVNPELQDLIQPTDSINNIQTTDSIK